MTDRKLRYSLAIITMLLLVGIGSSSKIENQETPNHVIRLELEPQTATLIFPMRQEFLDSFERSALAPWTTGGTAPWAIRDTLDTYGPGMSAVSGYRYAGIPGTDIATYPGNETDSLVTPTIDLTGWDSLFLSFSYWADFEGAATNFDGGIVQISSNNGVTWVQVDSLAQGHLNPTYDQNLVGTGQIGTVWAYCYDRYDWVAVSSLDLMGLGYVAAGNQIKIRFVFDSDDLSGGQGWFIDDVRIADTSPQDLQAPLIVHEPLPDTTDTISAYTISATITDNSSGVNPDSVILYYEIENMSPVEIVMDSIGADIYEADIPAQPWHTDIWYKIMAADYAGNWAETQLNNFEVTNARTIIYDDGQPWYAPNYTADGYFTRFRFSDVDIDTGLLHQVKILFEGPGSVDVRVYQATATTPGPLIDSIRFIESPGYDWYTVDLDPLNIQSSNPYGIVVGYVENAPDSVGILRDAICEHPDLMWNIQANVWTPEGTGDFLMRLKVIPVVSPGVEENTNKTLSVFNLAPIKPNPVTTTGRIEYQLPTAQAITLKVYAASGQLIRTLVDERQSPGTHAVIWDGRDAQGKEVASGVYLCRLQGENEGMTEKLIMVH